jgi:tetratricopeptide (TPR) repeat protein
MMDKPWQSWLNAASFHMEKTQDFAEAERLLAKALHLAPEEQTVWYTLAKFGFLSKNRVKELAWLNKIQQAGSRDESIINRLAGLLLQDGKTDEAINLLEDLLSHMPDNRQALINIGIGYKLSNDHRKAIEKFMKVIELTPEDPKPWFHLSEVSRALGKTEEAEIFGARAKALHA